MLRLYSQYKLYYGMSKINPICGLNSGKIQNDAA